MPTPQEHALLSASSAGRWLHCTRAPRLEETLPEKTSAYAEEGRLAHAIAELKARKHFTPLGARKSSAEMKKLKEASLYQEEMQGYTDEYLDFLKAAGLSYTSAPHVALEVRVDFSETVPEGFGTCDCLLIGGDTLHIVDFKYGKGVPVSAKDNPQMRLYALGALKTYYPLYGASITKVRMSIVQPRSGGAETEELTRDELLDWGVFEVKPKALLAFHGEGEFAPGAWCRFCRSAATCRANSQVHTALEDFGGSLPPLLTDAEVGEILGKAQGLKAWVTKLEDYALTALLEGKVIPGWKAVEGRSNRQFTDLDAAFQTLRQHGYDEALLYERKPIPLTEAEKLVGKREFTELLGPLVYKPQGKPTLVSKEDKRPVFHPAGTDFAGVTE